MPKDKGPKGPKTADTKPMEDSKAAALSRFEKEHPGFLARIKEKDGPK